MTCLLYSRMGPAIEASGGSAGNTAAGVASFGGRAAFFGKVCIGNAIVDIIAQCEEDVLQTNGIIKGAMNLIDTHRAELTGSEKNLAFI